MLSITQYKYKASKLNLSGQNTDVKIYHVQQFVETLY